MPILLDKLLLLIRVFAVGGLLCAIAQLLIVRTKLTPGRILVIFLCAGILLETIGVFTYIRDFAHAGATIPILGFGATLARGAIEGVREHGIIGAFFGGLAATALGITVATISSFIATLAFKPKTK